MSKEELGVSSLRADRATRASTETACGLGPDGRVSTDAGPATPLPWRVRTIDASAGNIEDFIGAAVAQVQLNEWHNEAGLKERHALREQDAAFIVRACNSFLALYNAAEVAQTVLGSIHPNDRTVEEEEALNWLAAALAKARGEA